MSTLPYIATPGNVEKALNAIKSAATPARVSQDFVKTILQIPGGSGNQMTSYLRKIGFAGEDGTPTELYRKFRNPATEGSAASAALRIGYKPLFERNEYMYQLTDEKLRGLVIEETGWSNEATTLTLTIACIKQLKKFAKWDVATDPPTPTPATPQPPDKPPSLPAAPLAAPPNSASLPQQFHMQLGYTINLNLPATSDVAVFNAIFKSLKEHLLKNSNG